ncbi:TPA: Rrf2 family transcriptional regulator [Klebsiella oxytoca]|uniref:Rrf2 family transcriptional regulator n=1 Tax=Klebsiella oxytoca TaxID=571 RepID=A0AAN5LE93_KLEOX|nr:Rrf2 family transcriptional regulator [Klebsiella oxytoca]
MQKTTRRQVSAAHDMDLLASRAAQWAYREQRPVTAAEIAAHFNLPVHTARRVIHAILHRVDGTRCTLEMHTTLNPDTGQKRPLKYFTVHYLPGEENRHG